jgi:hypothetical protein
LQAERFQIEESVADQGWRVVDKDPDPSEWWLDELWTIEST